MIENIIGHTWTDFRNGAIQLQVDIGLRDSNNSDFVLFISLFENSTKQAIAVIPYCDWWEITEFIRYATGISPAEIGAPFRDIDYRHLLGGDALDVAGAISTYGKTHYGLGKQVICKGLSSGCLDSLPTGIRNAVITYLSAVQNFRRRFSDNPHDLLLLKEWGAMAIFYCPFIHGTKTEKKWRLRISKKQKFSMSDSQIVSLFAKTNKAVTKFLMEQQN